MNKPKQAKRRRPASPKLAQRVPKATAPEMLTRLHKAARQVGIHCVDNEWRGKDARYHFRCAQEHDFIRTLKTLTIQGFICPVCRDQARLAKIHTAAAQRGGQCLEACYRGNKVRYRFACAEGHRWSTLPDAVARLGRWCPHCAARQRGHNRLLDNGLTQLHAAAQARGGVCLSPVYAGIRSKYIFRCAKGHEWQAVGLQVARSRAWCVVCAKLDKVNAPARPSKASTPKAKSKRRYDPLTLRKSLGLNQREFWGALGVTQSGGCRFEKGQKMPQPVAMLLDLVYVKKFVLQQIDAGDMRVLRYLKQDKPDLYATLSKTVARS